MPERADVSLKIFDVVGRLVADLSPGIRPAGEHQVVWDGTRTAGDRAKAGVYLVRMKAGGRMATSRVVLVR